MRILVFMRFRNSPRVWILRSNGYSHGLEEQGLPEKKRLPPWEEARLLFKMQEETRKRKLLEEDMKHRHARAKKVGPNTLDELEENRKRLKELQQRLDEEEADA